MNESLITVIVPFYNTREKIKCCIDSIVNQTYKNIEILLINDGSTDNSLKICEEVAQEDNRIKIINLEHGGVSIARNCGIEQARGEYIMFVDSDDSVEYTIIEKLFLKINETNADICQAACKVVDTNGKHVKTYEVPVSGCINREDIIKKIVLPLFGRSKKDIRPVQGFCVCKLFKKSIIQNIRFSERQLIYQDICFNIDAYLTSQKACFIDEPLYNYIINSNSSTQRRRDDRWLLCMSLLEDLNSRVNRFLPKYLDELNERIHMTASTNLIYSTRNIFKTKEKNNFYDAVKKVKEMRENPLFDNGVTNPNLGTMFSILSMLLRYRLYLPAVLIAKLAR
ncbi:MAG: glycosyltransferase [Clostridia bacterium]|nr:glycosyltransferase [Clostridia bacterium]